MDTATQRTPGETTATVKEPVGRWAKFQAWRAKNAHAQEVLFFFAGFCFDLLLLHSIDSVPMLIHQGSYVVLLAILLGVDHHYQVKGEEPKGFWGKVLSFRVWVIHFLFGTLLNAFVVFYFRASALQSLGFIIFMPLLAGVLIANELPRFRTLGPLMRVALLSFVITSFLADLLPVVIGEIATWMFVLSSVLSCLAIFGLWKAYGRYTQDPRWTFSRAVGPSLITQVLLLGLYFAGVVPPVPLSLKYIGVYHEVEKVTTEEGKKYDLLKYVPAGFKPWEHGAQPFKARPGDKVHVWTRIFAPRNFRDGIRVRWAWADPRSGWQWTDAIPLTVRHSGENGWWGSTYKQNWVPGDWKVRVETDDGRVIGAISLTIVQDDSVEPREYVEERR